MIITAWKCNQSLYVSYLPAYNSYYRERTGKRMELSISNHTRSTCRASPQQEAVAEELSCFHFTIAGQRRFDALNYVLRPYLYCC